MRGSNQDSAISRENAIPKALVKPILNSYSVKGISFEMLQAPRLNNRLYSLAKVDSVEMCSSECTQELFEAVMSFNPSDFKGRSDSSKRPVENVSWFDCIAFCNRLSQELGLAPYYGLTDIKHGLWAPESITGASVEILGGNGFRLPTETEWELFARAGTNNKWSGTNIEAELEDYAWYKENSYRKTHPVATKKPNEWGMYDMSGNVEEWCWDKSNSEDGSSSANRVLHGGNFYENALGSRSVSHTYNYPGDRHSTFGLRFCRSLG